MNTPTVLVVNGERYWHDYFPDAKVRYCQLQTAQWLLEDGVLTVLDAQGVTRIDAVLWRVGAIRPHPLHRAALELIRLSGIPCVNSAHSLLRGFDRLSMRAEMQTLEIPMLPQTYAVGSQALEHLSAQLPAALKVGNLHAGYGKAKLETVGQWNDLRDLLYAADDYATLEPFVEYVRDLRCLAIGDEVWAMERRSSTWKANQNTTDFTLIDPPENLLEHTRKAMQHLGADILGLDFLELPEGGFVLLETNDVPGLAGFPDSLKYHLSQRLIDQLERQ